MSEFVFESESAKVEAILKMREQDHSPILWEILLALEKG